MDDADKIELNTYVLVNIVNRQKDGVNQHYTEYDGQKGIIYEIDTEGSRGIRYLMYYEDADFRTVD